MTHVITWSLVIEDIDFVSEKKSEQIEINSPRKKESSGNCYITDAHSRTRL